MRRGLLLITLSFIAISCRETSSISADYRPGIVTETSKDFLIPRQLKSEIEKKYLEFIRKESPKIVLPDEDILARIPREFLDVEIKFHAGHNGVLKHDTIFQLPRGGGTIDLKDYVVGERGSFYMKATARRSADPTSDLKSLRIYFLSEVKNRKIDGDTFGVGCGKFLEITNQMINAKNGFHLNATDDRYHPVIGGTFYFVDFDPERKMYLAAVRVENSRFTDQNCADEK